jgi:hypothetical protein
MARGLGGRREGLGGEWRSGVGAALGREAGVRGRVLRVLRAAVDLEQEAREGVEGEERRVRQQELEEAETCSGLVAVCRGWTAHRLWLM